MTTDDRLLRRAEVEAILGVGRTTFHGIRKQGDFPAPVTIAKNAQRWRSGDVRAWIDSRSRHSETGPETS